MKKLFTIIALVGSAVAAGAQFKLNFTPSPDETNNKVLGYVAVWRYTNAASSNDWRNFGTAPIGTTNVYISTLVPSPAYVAVCVQGTNYLLSSPTNVVLYDTNALAAIYTNNPTPPRPPGTNFLSQ